MTAMPDVGQQKQDLPHHFVTTIMGDSTNQLME
jgi:hypothetical protein